ncbi:MAG: sulfatase [Deltaproteobacteria bacterium]|nr:sulfatase [Deltaproteobacteria bacterium]
MAIGLRVRGALVPAVAGGVGGMLAGLAEAGRVHLGARHLPGPHDLLLLLLAGGLGSLLPGFVAGACAGLLFSGLSLARRAWVGLLTGLLTVLLWDGAVRWFTDPPPFTEPGLLRGNPAIFAAIVVGVVLVLLVLALRVRRTGLVALAVLLVLAGLGVSVAASRRSPVDRPRAPEGAPNVLWVTLDTVRADHTSLHGGRARTPALERLAAEGLSADLAFAQIAVTGPSHATALTGVGPWKHGLLLNGRPIPEHLTTVPEILRQAGYVTGAFVSAQVLEGRAGFDRGFDLYDDDFSLLKGSGDLLAARTWDRILRRPDTVVERRGDRTVGEAIRWLAVQPEPWLLWVHLFDPHGPYEPPEGFREAYFQSDPRPSDRPPVTDLPGVAPYLKASLEGITDPAWVVAGYDGEITYADHQLGRLVGLLDARGLADRTLVLVHGDHGEDLGEHGVWFDHGDFLYDPSLHVPLVLRLPGRIAAGTRVADPVELTDVAPTLLDLLGLPVPDTMEGRSILKPGARLQSRGLCFDRPANEAARERGEILGPTWRAASLRSRGHLFIRREAPAVEDEWYDLVADPEGLRDVLSERVADPEQRLLAGLLRERADRILARTGGDAAAGSSAGVTREQAEALGALGYTE